MIPLIVSTIVLIIILVVLFLASVEDLKYRRINKWTVVFLYVLVPVYLYSRNIDMLTASFCFMFTLAVFAGLWFISFGSFGMGDVLVISALGWMVADFSILYVFLLTMGVLSIPWGLFWAIKYKQDPRYSGVWHGFKKIIQTKNLLPGMVKAEDNFMQGLDGEQIEKIQKSGVTTMRVKQPMPYIPVVFATVLIYTLFPTYLVALYSI